MSKILSSGLDGVSSQIKRVSLRSALATSAGSVMSTKDAWSPMGRITLSKRRKVPPYTSSPEITWSPGESV
jgi:hypothetical protein